MDTHPFKHLHVDHDYVVIEAFKDFDGQTHPVGETWTFVGHSFLPYDDGLSLFIRLPDGGERQIRMRWMDGDQGEIVDALSKYVAPA